MGSVMELLLFDTTKRNDSFKSTVLSFGAGYGCKELVKAMVDSGTDVNKSNIAGYSPLTCAVENGDKECVSLILQAGAAVNYETPIVYAAARGQCEIVSLLLNQGAAVNYCDENGCTALFRACAARHIECVKLLLDAGADVNIGDNYFTTPSIIASENGRVEFLKQLVGFGADVNASECRYGDTSLLVAAWARSSECVDFLLENGADVNAVDNRGDSALVIATRGGSLSCVESLLRAGAHVNIGNICGSKALQNVFLGMRLATVLHVAGEIMDMGGSLPDWLKESKAQLNLMDACREAIRKHLLNLDLHGNLFCRVAGLGLPTALFKYLLYNVSFGDNNSYGDI